MATTKTKKYMPEVKATGKGTAAGALIGALIKKGVLDKEQTRTRAKQYRKLTGKGLSDGQAISKIKLYESLLIKPKTSKKQEGGQAVTSRRMTRLGNKIAKKTGTGKTVSTGLQRRFDKSVDKVIVKQLKKSTKSKKAMGGPTEGSTTPAPIPKQAPMTPLTEDEKRKLQVRWEQVNKRPLPANTNLTPSSENFRTGSGPYSVNITPNQKPVTPPIPAQKRGGIKMAKGGTQKLPIFSLAKKALNTKKKSLPKNQLGGTPAFRELDKDKWGRSPDNKWYGFDPVKKKWANDGKYKDVSLYSKEQPKEVPKGKKVSAAILKTITNPNLNISHYQHYGKPGALEHTDVKLNAGSITPTIRAKGGATKAKRFAGAKKNTKKK